MDLYITSLLLGVVGLGAMAVTGLGSHSHAGHGHAGGNGHGNGGHGGASHAGHGNHAVQHAGHTHHAGQNADRGGAGRLLSLMSPRLLFSLALGFGASGELLRSSLGGPLLVVAALAGAVLFERVLVTPLWNFTMRFASKPATTLESAVYDEATAVTAFDEHGQGIVSLEVDGQIVQILATLKPDDQLLGTGVRAGQRVRVEEVDAEKNSCTVSVL